jgi:O-antigen/teichoic acid export membrane protein
MQFIKIGISIIRSKAVAILIGPEGIGIIGLLNGSLSIIGGLTHFGLNISAVRDIAEADGKDDRASVAQIIGVLRRLVWLTGGAGTLLTMIFAQWLSHFSFGNDDYTWPIRIIAVVILINQITSGKLAVLKSLGKLKLLANANILGSILTLAITIPIYYYFRLDGIVPSILLAAMAVLVATVLFTRQIKIDRVIVPLQTFYRSSMKMIKLGVAVSFSGLALAWSNYLLKAYISNVGGVADVGLFTAGFTILNTYVGLIFTAMATDYFPKLSAVSTEANRMQELVNQQGEIALLILGPIIISFSVFADWLLIILYSEDFLAVNLMMIWAMIGIIFKGASWPVGMILLAKGETRIYLLSELFANSALLLFSAGGYHYFGLTGLGVAFLIFHLIYLIQIFVLSNKRYGFRYYNSFLRIFFTQLLIASVSLIIALQFEYVLAMTLGTVLLFVNLAFSYVELDKRIEIKSLLKK